MAFPLSIDDCFLNTNVNRFPVEDALKHKSRLLEEGRPGKTVDIYQTDGMKMGYHLVINSSLIIRSKVEI